MSDQCGDFILQTRGCSLLKKIYLFWAEVAFLQKAGMSIWEIEKKKITQNVHRCIKGTFSLFSTLAKLKKMFPICKFSLLLWHLRGNSNTEHLPFTHLHYRYMHLMTIKKPEHYQALQTRNDWRCLRVMYENGWPSGVSAGLLLQESVVRFQLWVSLFSFFF